MKSIIKTIIPFALVIAYPAAVSAREKQARKKDSITLTINFLQAAPKDTLTLRIGEYFVGLEPAGPVKKYIAVQNTKGRYVFRVPVAGSAGYFDLYAIRKKSKVFKTNQRAITELQFWEAGDKISIEIDNIEKAAGINSLCKFEGRNAVNYQARQELIKLANHFEGIEPYVRKTSPPDTIKQRLVYYKPQMSVLAYQVLETDLKYSIVSNYLEALVFVDSSKAAADPRTKEIYEFLKSRPQEVAPGYAYRSQNYLLYKMRIAKLYRVFDKSLNGNLFNSIISINKGMTKQLLLMHYFGGYYKHIDPQKEYSKAEFEIKDPVLKNYFNSFSYKLPGLKWVDYQLTDSNGKKISLSQFDDKIVLIDFWFTGCGYCANYYKKVLSKIKGDFKGTDVIFLSVSLDRKFEVWKESIAGGEYTDDKANNVYTSGQGFEHPIAKENGIIGGPYAVLLNKGRILYQYNTENLFKLNQLKNTLTALLSK